MRSAQSRQAIQVLEEARDAIQTIHIGSTSITTGSIDGYVRTYDLRKGELRSDFIGRRVLFLYEMDSGRFDIGF
jgi:mitogen-activated protein kinase organizer 1